MVQGLNQGISNQFGNLTKIGENKPGRTVYQVQPTDDPKVVKRISVPTENCDSFEKTYNDMMEVAPKLVEFEQKYGTEDAIKKRKKQAAWTLSVPTIVGAGIPLLKGTSGKWGALKNSLLALTGAVVGFAAGLGILKATAPKPEGIDKLKDAMDNMAKLDVQPEE